MGALFSDRRDAGRQLARKLTDYAGSATVVIGLPRGGVLVAAEVADELGAPLDICVVRKVGVPGHDELAMGAVAEGGFRVVDQSIVRWEEVPEEVLERRIAIKEEDVRTRTARFRGDRPAVDLHGKTVIVVDDGLATGSTARVALRSVRARGAVHVVLAVPVAAADSLRSMEAEADEVVCPFPMEDFTAVGLWYDHFDQTSDEEVVRLLAERAG